MEQVLVQVRIDKKLKQEVTAIYESLGLDLPTAVRMFLMRSKLVRGIPFDVTLPEESVSRSEAMQALDELFDQAKDVPEMSLDEINAEIEQARASRKANKR